MTRRLSFLDDESQEMGLGSLLGGGAGGAVARRPQRGTRFWNPSDALARQPFHGFPGGRRAWESFKSSGELPEQAQGLSPEARSHYYNRIPYEDVQQSLMATDPETGLLLQDYSAPSMQGPVASRATRVGQDQLISGQMGNEGRTAEFEGLTSTPGLSQTPNAGLTYEGTPNKQRGWADLANANTYADVYADSFANANTYGYADTYYANPVNFNYGRQNASTTPGQQTNPNGNMAPAAGDPLGRLLGMR